MNGPFPPSRERNPKLDDCQQSSCQGRPQTGEQKNSHADRDDLCCKKRGVRKSPKFGAAANYQSNTCRQPQEEKSSPGPSVGKRREQTLQTVTLLKVRGLGGKRNPPSGFALPTLSRVYNSMIPRLRAIITACVRAFAPSLERMFLT